MFTLRQIFEWFQDANRGRQILTPSVDCAVAVLGRGCVAQVSGRQSTAVRSLLVETKQHTDRRANWGRRLRESASRCPSVCVAIPALTASLGSGTDTLTYNWDGAYVKHFPSQLKTPTWAHWGIFWSEMLVALYTQVNGMWSLLRGQCGLGSCSRLLYDPTSRPVFCKCRCPVKDVRMYQMPQWPWWSESLWRMFYGWSKNPSLRSMGPDHYRRHVIRNGAGRHFQLSLPPPPPFPMATLFTCSYVVAATEVWGSRDMEEEFPFYP
jgi:hypothetical protein